MNNFFPMAVLLAWGKRLKLASWHLDALYSRLDACARNVVLSVERYDVVSYADANYLQLFLWERFKALSHMSKRGRWGR